MRRIILQTIPPALLFCAGIGCLIYGIAYHKLPVSAEQEIEVNIAPPPMYAPPGGTPFDPGHGPDGRQVGLVHELAMGSPPMMGPPAAATKIKEKVFVTSDRTELALIREVSVGGVTLLDSGQLMQTYTGEPPSLCPT